MAQRASLLMGPFMGMGVHYVQTGRFAATGE
jgi:hypothetical protein